jgi:hypothetical protein
MRSSSCTTGASTDHDDVGALDGRERHLDGA